MVTQRLKTRLLKIRPPASWPPESWTSGYSTLQNSTPEESPLEDSTPEYTTPVKGNYWQSRIDTEDGTGHVRCSLSTQAIAKNKASEAAIIAHITICNPMKANSLSASLLDALTKAFRMIALKPGIRCVVLSGASSQARTSTSSEPSNHFCSGMVSYRLHRMFTATCPIFCVRVSGGANMQFSCVDD